MAAMASVSNVSIDDGDLNFTPLRYVGVTVCGLLSRCPSRAISRPAASSSSTVSSPRTRTLTAGFNSGWVKVLQPRGVSGVSRDVSLLAAVSRRFVVLAIRCMFGDSAATQAAAAGGAVDDCS